MLAKKVIARRARIFLGSERRWRAIDETGHMRCLYCYDISYAFSSASARAAALHVSRSWLGEFRPPFYFSIRGRTCAAGERADVRRATRSAAALAAPAGTLASSAHFIYFTAAPMDGRGDTIHGRRKLQTIGRSQRAHNHQRPSFNTRCQKQTSTSITRRRTGHAAVPAAGRFSVGETFDCFQEMIGADFKHTRLHREGQRRLSKMPRLAWHYMPSRVYGEGRNAMPRHAML